MKAITIITASLAFAGYALADGSYQETTQVTNGAAVQASRLAGAFDPNIKDLTRPKTKILMVHGNRLVEVSDKTSQIIDLDKGTMTTVDNAKRTYTTMTFEQLGKMMNSFRAGPQPQSTAAPNPNAPQITASDIKVENTGAVKQFGNVTARETRLSITVRSADPASGKGAHTTTTMDVWKADTAPGYEEVQAFYKRMSEKASWVQQQQQQRAPAASPATGDGIVTLAREAAKIKGISVREVTTVQMAIDGLGQGDATTLEEITTERSQFSTQPAVLSEFEVPAGFKEVPSPLLKYLK
jgi:acetylornithine deacetylase/succinyl-diaminopimelate desuccinylase-like protein